MAKGFLVPPVLPFLALQNGFTPRVALFTETGTFVFFADSFAIFGLPLSEPKFAFGCR